MSRVKHKINQQVLIPQYMNNFKCIGSSCEDSCCAGWKVTVDENTFRKYRKSNHVILKPMFKKFIKRQRSQSTEANFAKIQMNSNNACSFLDENRLCSIQMALGEDYLSNTCAVYPRILNKVNSVLEKSATLSCPEAARLVLLNPEGIQFEKFEETNESRGYFANSITSETADKDNIKAYFWDLRIFSIKLMQNRKYLIEDRLILLGIFYKQLQKKIDSETYDEISELINTFDEMITKEEFNESLKNIPSKPVINIRLFKEIIKNKFSKGIDNTRYYECLKEMVQGFNDLNNNNDLEDMKKYFEVKNNYYDSFIKDKEYIFENYIVNYIFKNLFPLSYNKPFEDYMMLVVHFSLIKMHLIGMSGFHKGLSLDLVVKAIQSFSKSVEHDSLYLNRILSFLNDNQCDEISYMSIFIKG